MRTVLVLVGLVGSLTTAEAGRRGFGWSYDAEVLPERGAEIETWLFEENGKSNLANEKSTFFVWAASVGITDNLELFVPAEWRWSRSDERPGNFTFTRYGIEARYRFVTQDPVDRPALAPLVRLAVKRDVIDRDAVRPELDLVVAYTANRVHVVADLGFVGSITSDDSRFEIRPSGGISYEVVNDLRLGAEVYAELGLDGSDTSWAAAGPSLSWTHGRFWLTATYGIGLYQIDDAPRAMWGLAF